MPGFAKGRMLEKIGLKVQDTAELSFQELSTFQNTKFELARCLTEVEAAQALLDRALAELVAGELSAANAVVAVPAAVALALVQEAELAVRCRGIRCRATPLAPSAG